MKDWLNIIGMSERGIDEVPLKARAVLEQAKYILGAKRLLDKITYIEGQKLIEWQTPFSANIEQITKLQGKEVVILATGDANWYGIGASLLKYFNAKEFNIFPNISSFQLAASKLHWPMQNIDCISLHGRKVENLHPFLQPKNRILALTSDSNTLIEVAKLLKQRGYENSTLTVFENLGSKDERVISFLAIEAKKQKIADFYLLAIDCVAEKNAPLLPKIAGLPDEAFISDGQLTKSEVRAITIAKLAPFNEALLWDIGAGSGSVAIEFMRSARGAKAICFEKNKKRIKYIEQNRLNLGVPNLKIISGDALENITNQPSPDAIFLGGDIKNEKLFEACFRALKIGGRIVANAVTIEGEMALLARHKNLGGELIKIDISKAKRIGKYQIFANKKSITQWLIIKGQE